MAKFELFEGKDNQWYWNLHANNGEIIASSEGYTSKQAAEHGIDVVKELAGEAEVEEKE